MKTIRTLLAGLFVAVLSVGGGNAVRGEDKQTEPVKTTPAPKIGKKYTPEELVEVLENLGYTTKTFNNKEGVMTEITLEIQTGGWTIRPFIHWNASKTQYVVGATLVSHDGKAPLDPELLQAMLVLNAQVFPASICYVGNQDGTGTISIFADITNENLTPAVVRQKLDRFCEFVKAAVVARDKAKEVAKAKAQAKADPKEPALP